MIIFPLFIIPIIGIFLIHTIPLLFSKLNKSVYLSSMLLRVSLSITLVILLVHPTRTTIIEHTDTNIYVLYAVTGAILYSFVSLIISFIFETKFIDSENKIKSLGYVFFIKYLLKQFVIGLIMSFITYTSIQALILYFIGCENITSVLLLMWTSSLPVNAGFLYIDNNTGGSDNGSTGGNNSPGNGNNGDPNPNDGITGAAVVASTEPSWDHNNDYNHAYIPLINCDNIPGLYADRVSWGRSGGPNCYARGIYDYFLQLSDKDAGEVPSQNRIFGRNNTPLSRAYEYSVDNPVPAPNIPDFIPGQLMHYSLLNLEALINLNTIAQPFVSIEVTKGISEHLRICLMRHIFIAQKLAWMRWHIACSVHLDQGQIFGDKPYNISKDYWYSRIDRLMDLNYRRDTILRNQFEILKENTSTLKILYLKKKYDPWYRFRRG